jgi:hypothetical protein
LVPLQCTIPIPQGSKERPVKKLNDVADILIELVARGGGNETLDPLYDLIADHPGSINFTMEQGRDALLIAVARVVQMLAEGRRHIADQKYELAARDLVSLTDQFGRLAKLAAFLERSGQESLRAYGEGRPAGPLDPFNVQGQSRGNT